MFPKLLRLKPRNFGQSLLFGSLRSILSPLLFSSLPPGRIQNASYYMVPDSGQILHSSATNQNHRVFLQLMSFAGNIDGHFHTISKPNSGYFSQSRVWFFWRHGGYLDADSPLKRRWIKFRLIFQNVKTTLQSRRF